MGRLENSLQADRTDPQVNTDRSGETETQRHTETEALFRNKVSSRQEGHAVP